MQTYAIRLKGINFKIPKPYMYVEMKMPRLVFKNFLRIGDLMRLINKLSANEIVIQINIITSSRGFWRASAIGIKGAYAISETGLKAI